MALEASAIEPATCEATWDSIRFVFDKPGMATGRERAQAVLQRQGKVAHLLQLVLHGLRVGTSLLKLALRRLRLLTGLLCGRRQPAHGRTRIGNRIDGARKLRGRAVLRGAQILFGLGDLIVERVRHHRADRGNELAVDSLIKGGGTRVVTFGDTGFIFSLT